MQKKQFNEAQKYAFSFQKGEEQGFDWVFRVLYPSLSFYAWRITNDPQTAEEIASEAFIKIWQRHAQFNAFPSIKAYLYRTVHNEALLYLRRLKKERQFQNELSYLCENESHSGEFPHLAAAETLRIVKHALALLPPACATVIHLLFFQGKTVSEAAVMLHLSPNTVKAQRRKGLARLRKEFASLNTLIAIILSMLV